jgi:hypothetical protein
MPAMPRVKGLGTKIAFNVLGKPENLNFKRSKAQEYVNKQLNAQETSRVR